MFWYHLLKPWHRRSWESQMRCSFLLPKDSWWMNWALGKGDRFLCAICEIYSIFELTWIHKKHVVSRHFLTHFQLFPGWWDISTWNMAPASSRLPYGHLGKRHCAVVVSWLQMNLIGSTRRFRWEDFFQFSSSWVDQILLEICLLNLFFGFTWIFPRIFLWFHCLITTWDWIRGWSSRFRTFAALFWTEEGQIGASLCIKIHGFTLWIWIYISDICISMNVIWL